jgi:hypothetical protein
MLTNIILRQFHPVSARTGFKTTTSRCFSSNPIHNHSPNANSRLAVNSKKSFIPSTAFFFPFYPSSTVYRSTAALSTMAQLDVAVNLTGNIELMKPLDKRFQGIITPEALVFLKHLHQNFEPRRREMLAARAQRQAAINDGRERLDFLASTKSIREDPTWAISPLPIALHRRRVEITGPVDRKMVINALNSGADCYMADFEDSTAPT